MCAGVSVVVREGDGRERGESGRERGEGGVREGDGRGGSQGGRRVLVR